MNFIVGKDGTAAIKPEFVSQIFIVTYSSGEVKVIVVNNSEFNGFGTTLGTFNDSDKTTNLTEAKAYLAELVKKLDKSFIVGQDGTVAIKPEFIAQVDVFKNSKGETEVITINHSGLQTTLATFNSGDIEADSETAKAYFAELVKILNGGGE